MNKETMVAIENLIGAFKEAETAIDNINGYLEELLHHNFEEVANQSETARDKMEELHEFYMKFTTNSELEEWISKLEDLKG